MNNYEPLDINRLKHSKLLNRSICMPSMVQTYSLCIEYMKAWFYSKFENKDFIKSEYIDGKYIYDDFRKLSKIELLKRQKPSLTITPTIDWEYDNDKIDSYPYGLSLYTMTGKFKNSFFTDNARNVYLGFNMETILMRFTFRLRVETRAQQLDLYKYMRVAHRVGYSDNRDVDMDFHVPYPMIIQMARDLGFDVVQKEDGYDKICDIPKFLRYLNMHSSIPFVYKHRTINGKNEFFIRVSRLNVNIRPTSISADDGDREGFLSNNFNIELETEVRFPAPRMYAYYSVPEHHLNKVYTAWDQPTGSPVTIYSFKAIPIQDENKYGWPLYMKTQYDQTLVEKDKPLVMDCHELIEGEIGSVIKDCLEQGISPAIFFDMCIINGGELVKGNMNWETLTFTSVEPVRSLASFIGIYIDMNYVNNTISNRRGLATDRLRDSDHPNSRQAVAERGESV